MARILNVRYEEMRQDSSNNETLEVLKEFHITTLCMLEIISKIFVLIRLTVKL